MPGANYRLEFVKRYPQCEAYNFNSIPDPVLFLKKQTDYFGADICIDAAGCEVPKLIKHARKGRINSKEIITHKISLKEVSDAHYMFSQKLD